MSKPPHLQNEDDEDDRTFWQRYGVIVIVGVVVLVGGGFALKSFLNKGSSPRAERSVTMVALPPPPPPPPPRPTPPPPPPPPQQQPQEKMTEVPQQQDEAKPDEPKPDKPDEAPAPGTSIKGDGAPDGFGLGSNTGGWGGFGRGGKGGNGRSKYAAYFSQSKSALVNAVKQHPKTKYASFRSNVSVWSDSTGRVTKVSVSPKTGDAAADAALEKDIAASLRIGPPPADLKMPLVIDLNVQRPRR